MAQRRFPSDQFSWSEYNRLAASTRSFRDFIAVSSPQTIVIGGEVVRARFVSTNYFEALGVTPVIGRAFGSADRTAVVVVRFQWHSGDFPSFQFSWSGYNRFAANTRSFRDLIATSSPQTIVIGGEVLQIPQCRISLEN